MNIGRVLSRGHCEVIVKCRIDMITIILVTSPLNQSQAAIMTGAPGPMMIIMTDCKSDCPNKNLSP